MKRLLSIFVFAFIFFAGASAACAANYDITEYEGDNGFARHNPSFENGDILFVRNNITAPDNSVGAITAFSNIETTIKGNGHTISGNNGQARGFLENVDTNLTIENAVLTNFVQYDNTPVVIGQLRGDLKLTDVDILNNSLHAADEGNGAIILFEANAEIIAKDRNVLFSGNSNADGSIKRDIAMNNSKLYLYPAFGKEIRLMGGIGGTGSLYVGGIKQPGQIDEDVNYGTLVLGGDNSTFGIGDGPQSNIAVINSTVKLLTDAKYFNEGVNNTYEDGTLDLQNGVIDSIEMKSLSVKKGMRLKIDVDLEQLSGDNIKAGAFDTGAGKIVMQKINLLTDFADKPHVFVRVLSGDRVYDAAALDSSQRTVDGLIYSYDVDLIDTADSVVSLKFTPNGRFARSVLGTSFALQGARLLQEELSHVLFENSGNFSFFTKSGESAGDVPRDRPTVWVRAFAIDSEIDFDKYGKADTDYYGGIAGIDFDRLYDGFNATYGLFGSYVSGKQKDDGNDIKQSGGYAGARATFYFGKLFFSGILDAGILGNSAETVRGTDDFNSYTYCASVKGGYNFELSQRSFTLQPNVIGGFSYIDTEDYTSKSGVKITSDDMSVFTVMPGVKLAKNLGKCWILSADGHYVYSSVNGDVKANSVLLPEVNYDNYFSYGAGIEKIWGYTVAHLKASRSDGGKSGWNLSAGIEWKF